MARAHFTALAVLVLSLPVQAGADELTAIIQKDLQTLGYDVDTTDGELSVKTAVAISQFQAANNLDVTGEVTPQLAGVIKAAIRNQGQLPPQAQPAAVATTAPAAPMPGMDPAAMQAMSQGMAVPGMDPAMLAAMMQAQGAVGASNPAGQQAMMQAGMDPAAMQAMMAAMQDGAPAMDPAMLEAMQAQGEAAQRQSAQQACLQEKIAAAQKAQEAAQKRRGLGSLIRAAARIGGSDVQQAVAEAQGDLYNINATVSDLESAARDLGLTDEDVASCGAAQ